MTTKLKFVVTYPNQLRFDGFWLSLGFSQF